MRARALPLLLTFHLAFPARGAAEGSARDPQALANLVDEVVAEVETIRGLAFLRPVPVRIVDAATVRRYVLERIEAHLPPDLLENEADVYADLGMIEPHLDVLETMLELLQQEVAAFYDPEEEVVFLLDHQPWSAARVFLAHELAHALDDQHFDLDRPLRADDQENDRATAHASAREGSGTAVMTIAMTRAIRMGSLDAGVVAGLMKDQEHARGAMQRAPGVLQRSLIAPYLLGQHFVARGHPSRLWSESLAADLDTALTRLPESTEQILHPEKYWSEVEYDPPRRVTFDPLEHVIGASWVVAGEGTIGELDLACLTGPCEVPSVVGPGAGWTNAGAMGWGGDRWRLLRDGVRTLTVWAIVWDADDDAAEFESDARLPDGVLVRSDGRRTVVVAGELEADEDDVAQLVLRTLRLDPPER